MTLCPHLSRPSQKSSVLHILTGPVYHRKKKTTTPGAGSSSSDTCENQIGSAATHTSGVVRRSPRKTSGATVTPANISSCSSPLTTPAEGTGKSYCSWVKCTLSDGGMCNQLSQQFYSQSNSRFWHWQPALAHRRYRRFFFVLHV
jgi:hypothetical protein